MLLLNGIDEKRSTAIEPARSTPRGPLTLDEPCKPPSPDVPLSYSILYLLSSSIVITTSLIVTYVFPVVYIDSFDADVRWLGSFPLATFVAHAILLASVLTHPTFLRALWTIIPLILLSISWLVLGICILVSAQPENQFQMGFQKLKGTSTSASFPIVQGTLSILEAVIEGLMALACIHRLSPTILQGHYKAIVYLCVLFGSMALCSAALGLANQNPILLIIPAVTIAHHISVIFFNIRYVRSINSSDAPTLDRLEQSLQFPPFLLTKWHITVVLFMTGMWLTHAAWQLCSSSLYTTFIAVAVGETATLGTMFSMLHMARGTANHVQVAQRSQTDLGQELNTPQVPPPAYSAPHSSV